MWPKCAVQPALGHPSWRWTECRLRMMPPLGIIAGGTLVWWPRLWSSHSSSQRTWRPIGTSINHPELFLSLKKDLAMVSNCIRCSSFIHLHFLTLYSKSEILLVFICVFFFIGHTASFCGRGVGKERTWRDQGCLGCSSRSGGGVRRPKGKTS